jgi:Glycine zipper 2TM domain
LRNANFAMSRASPTAKGPSRCREFSLQGAKTGHQSRRFSMRKPIMIIAALSLVAPMLAVSAPADARSRAREWQGADGRTYCRKSNGTVGIIVGGAGGALLGRAVDTRGERATGTILGAAAGALVGREIDRNRRCR